MERRDVGRGDLFAQAAAKQLLEEMVVPIPFSMLVEPDQHHAVLHEAAQHLAARARRDTIDDGAAERGTEAVKDRGLKQEATHVRWLTRQHLVEQVVTDVLMATGGER